MTERYEYVLNLPAAAPSAEPGAGPGLVMAPVEPAACEPLAALMLAAYRGTIDDEGATLDDARAEIAAYLAGERGGTPDLAASRLVWAGDLLVGACLAGDWTARGCPLITYVMTNPAWKNRGLARLALVAALHALAATGARQARAVITAGNIPSERLFLGLGFQRVPPGSAAQR